LLSTNIFSYDCPVEATTCPKYPWQNIPKILDFKGVLGLTLNNYAVNNGIDLSTCDLENLQTEWFVDIKLNSNTIIQYPFFIGNGFNISYFSSPSTTNWDDALNIALPILREYGFDFYYTDDLQIVIFNELCVTQNTNTNIEINVGINFNLLCS
jgi:hypothetical protein